MPELDIGIIRRLLPHRYPMLLVDRVLDWEAGKFVRGVKNVTINEPFFQGHFPAYPVMPGVLVIEAMAQVAGLLTMLSDGSRFKRAELAVNANQLAAASLYKKFGFKEIAQQPATTGAGETVEQVVMERPLPVARG